jgi:hypothetical protein
MDEATLSKASSLILTWATVGIMAVMWAGILVRFTIWTLQGIVGAWCKGWDKLDAEPKPARRHFAEQLLGLKPDQHGVEPGRTDRAGDGREEPVTEFKLTSPTEADIRRRNPDLRCTECREVFTAAEVAREDPVVWGHPCKDRAGTPACESHRVAEPQQ